MKFLRYGVMEEDPAGYEIVYIADDEKYGRWLLFRAAKQEIEIRVTRSGLLRVSQPRKAGKIRAEGYRS